MSTPPGSAPSTGPSTAPPPTEVLFDDVKNQTDRELQKLKTELGVNESDVKHKEWEKIKEKFIAEKDTITKITRVEIDQLKADLHDENQELTGELKVERGALVYNEARTEIASDAPAPETPPVPVEGPTLAQFQAAIPPAEQEKIAEHSPENNLGNWMRDLLVKWIGGVFPEWAARFRGFANANVEKRADNAYNMLTGDEGTNILSGSPLTDILVLDHINKNDFKKILAQYPNLDFSNKRNIEAAFLGKHADKPELIKYHRIYEGMRQMCAELRVSTDEKYNPEDRLKKILSYSRDESVSVAYPDAVSSTAMPETIAAEPMDPSSPEVQKELMTQATEVDETLTKAQAMPEGTPEQRNTKTEAVKSAQEAVNTFKDQRKSNILSQYTSLKDRIKESEIERNTLIQRNSPEESEKKKLAEVNKNLEKLKRIETAMKIKIEEVMIQKDDKWEIKEGINAQKMTSVEIALSAIENNTATIEGQELTEEEKEKQEKMVLDLEKEFNETLHGKSVNKIDNPKDIADLEKKIGEKESYAINDELKAKITYLKGIIDHAKLKIQAVQAFLTHARWLAKDEGEIPDYKDDPDDFIHLEANGLIDINTVKVSDWSSLAFGDWADERWDLSDDNIKIAEKLGGKQEFVNVIKANVNGLINNEGLFSPKKGGDKFTILG